MEGKESHPSLFPPRLGLSEALAGTKELPQPGQKATDTEAARYPQAAHSADPLSLECFFFMMVGNSALSEQYFRVATSPQGLTAIGFGTIAWLHAASEVPFHHVDLTIDRTQRSRESCDFQPPFC